MCSITCERDSAGGQRDAFRDVTDVRSTAFKAAVPQSLAGLTLDDIDWMKVATLQYVTKAARLDLQMPLPYEVGDTPLADYLVNGRLEVSVSMTVIFLSGLKHPRSDSAAEQSLQLPSLYALT